MSKRGWLRIAVALSLLAFAPQAVRAQDSRTEPAAVAAAPDQSAPLPVIRIGTNLVAGLYYPAGGALCRAMAQYGTARCLVESTNGSTSNIRALLAGELEFGIVQSDWQYHAVQGSATFREAGPVKSLRSVLALHGEPLTLVVRADSGIDSFDQIKGKRIAAGPADSGQRILFDVLIAAWGGRLQAGGTLDESTPEAATATFCQGGIDAVLLMGNHPNVLTQRLLGCGGKLLAIDGPNAAKVMAGRQYYAPATIPAGLYGAEQPTIVSLGVRATLVTTDRVPADQVYALVKAVAGNFAEFTAQHPGLAGIRREEIARYGLTAPMHEGALRYFKEVGLVE